MVLKRVKVGVVVSDKMQKTKIVAVSDRVTNKRYGKVVTRTRRFAVHDHKFRSTVGDKVKILQVPAYSRTINWEVIRILGK